MGVNQDQSDSIGIKLSQVGQDVTTASDQDLIFSSSYPYLKMVARGLATVGGANIKTIYTHNLGYPPMFMLYYKSSTDSFFTSFVENQLMSNSNIGNGVIAVDNETLTFYPSYADTNDYVVYYYIFDARIDEDYTAPIIKNSSVSVSRLNGDFGIKVLRNDKSDIKSTDIRDYAIHSATRSMLLNKITYYENLDGNNSDFSGNYVAIQEHGLPYVPVYFTYLANKKVTFPTDPIDKWYYIATGTASYILLPTATKINFIVPVDNFKASIITFKNPFEGSFIPFTMVET